MLKFNRAPDRVDLVLRHTDPDRIDDLGADRKSTRLNSSH